LVKEHFAKRNAGTQVKGMMSYRAEYGSLLEDIAKEADIIAMKYFRADGMRVDRKSDGRR